MCNTEDVLNREYRSVANRLCLCVYSLFLTDRKERLFREFYRVGEKKRTEDLDEYLARELRLSEALVSVIYKHVSDYGNGDVSWSSEFDGRRIRTPLHREIKRYAMTADLDFASLYRIPEFEEWKEFAENLPSIVLFGMTSLTVYRQVSPFNSSLINTVEREKAFVISDILAKRNHLDLAQKKGT